MSGMLSEIFENIEFAPSVEGGKVIKIARRTSLNDLNINLELDEVIPMTELLNTSALISENLGVSATVYPKYHSSLFSPDYIYDIIELIKSKNALINGYLDGADISCDDSECEITLKSGGVEILKGMGVDKKIEVFIKGFFDRILHVGFTSENEMNINEYIRQENEKPPETVSIVEEKPKNSDTGNYGGAPSRSAGRGRGPQFLENPEKITLPFENEHFGKEAELFFGKANFEEPTSMLEPFNDQDESTVWGSVFKTDERISRDGKTLIYTVYFSDKTSSRIMKIITNVNNSDAVKSNLKAGKAVIVQGKFETDTFSGDLNLRPNSIASIKTHSRADNAEQKRVELHMHSRMSDMDAVTPVADLINQAYAWGHRAVAITDHGNVQAYPEAMNTIESINRDGEKMKMIYGVEAYFVNDSGSLVSGCGDYSVNGEIIVFDLETTGLSAAKDRITEIGAVKLKNCEITEEFQMFVNPGMPIPEEVSRLTGITDEMVEDADSEKEAVEKFIKFAGKGVLVDRKSVV